MVILSRLSPTRLWFPWYAVWFPKTSLWFYCSAVVFPHTPWLRQNELDNEFVCLWLLPEAQRHGVSCPRSHHWLVAEWRPDPSVWTAYAGVQEWHGNAHNPRSYHLFTYQQSWNPFSFLWSIWGWLKFKLLQSLKNIPRMISNLGQCWIVLKSRHSPPWDPLPTGCPFQSPTALATNKASQSDS